MGHPRQGRLTPGKGLNETLGWNKAEQDEILRRDDEIGDGQTKEQLIKKLYEAQRRYLGDPDPPPPKQSTKALPGRKKQYRT